jgi:hypothetical protein
MVSLVDYEVLARVGRRALSNQHARAGQTRFLVVIKAPEECVNRGVVDFLVLFSIANTSKGELESEPQLIDITVRTGVMDV